MGPDGAAGLVRAKQRALALAQPLSAQLELTYRCNWRCVFCYNPRHHDLRGLDAAEWIAVLDGLRSLGTLTVTLTGGEPLAHPAFVRIARAVRDRTLALRVFTNGALVTDRLADDLAALHPTVEMSLHGGRPATHDAATKRRGSFHAMLAGLDRLLARGVRCLLKTPLTHLNEDEIEEMAALADERGVAYLLDPTLTPRDDGSSQPLAYRASTKGLERAYRLVATRGGLPFTAREEGGANCGLGRITLAVDPEGSVFPCPQYRRQPLGNVRDRPLAAIWRSSEARSDAARLADASNARLLARGGALAEFPFCPALALERTGDALVPDAHHVELANLARRIRQEPE